MLTVSEVLEMYARKSSCAREATDVMHTRGLLRPEFCSLRNGRKPKDMIEHAYRSVYGGRPT